MGWRIWCTTEINFPQYSNALRWRRWNTTREIQKKKPCFQATPKMLFNPILDVHKRPLAQFCVWKQQEKPGELVASRLTSKDDLWLFFSVFLALVNYFFLGTARRQAREANEPRSYRECCLMTQTKSVARVLKELCLDDEGPLTGWQKKKTQKKKNIATVDEGE